ncbi:EAL domain-containing protein [Exilibacterium tricleocarpae]|uniref:EAL domain-containing protein n=1 Tax=Exilibacterium tricleocarpae TaxID=2591008 RepID=A0A545TSG0_9GAMM|nr:EAL domain-containing protein [Exilibacterium tricleocarpae]TQV80152.1 EAL domain-containing protein [Exilibacterium tricleocarpae]
MVQRLGSNTDTTRQMLNKTPSKYANVYLMAEDDPGDAELVKQLLHQAFGDSYSVICVDRFGKVLDALAKGHFEALILDMNLPDRSGVKNITALGNQYPDLPIVVLTGQDDLEQAVDSLNSGAQDYLSKNQVTPELLSRSLRYARERKNIESKLKKALQEQAHSNARLKNLAQHDTLTTLPNRAHFQITVPRMLMRAARAKKWVALLYVDLNGFKKINDSYGHPIGDELLRQLAARLKATVRDSDFLARLGGDEFVLMTDLLEDKREVYKLIGRLLAVFDQPFTLDKHEVPCTPSIGVAFYPDADNLELLMKQADCAMYEAKNQENSAVCFYTTQLESQYARNMEIEAHVNHALEAAQFDVQFQPLVSSGNPGATHIEALMRWRSPELGDIPPSEFIPIIENSPTINEITHIVVRECGRLLKSPGVFNLGYTRLALNVCVSQISSAAFCDQLLAWLKDFGIAADNICLELTEGHLMKNVAQCGAQLQRLRSLGIHIALDDVGIGYSSFAHLLELPLDYLKLNRILIDHIDKKPRNQALAVGIVEMAHRLGIKVVAVGIEREEEFRTARQLGCDYLQGYYIAAPMQIGEISRYAKDRPRSDLQLKNETV